MEKILSFLTILSVNLLFVLLLAGAVAILAGTRHAAYAVLKRNFLAYFTSPTGYVFLCLFVWLTAVAAFWTEDFFNSNLANLDQLNHYLPLILLVFIPAITMSIWSEERRQGTDELLLTIPAADSDIVLGKYLAAVAIYTVSLLFSQMCNYIVLATLGNPDAGLLLGNYLGYWLAGLAMLSIGMVASFLTNNLTVGFVLGVLLNVPLVMAGYADVVFGPWLGGILARWSIAQQFADFQAGVVSFSSVVFFLMIAAVMFYLSLVLIGRRHWSGGRDGHAMGPHFIVRVCSLLLCVGAVCVLLSRWDPLRADLTSERLNSLHPDTVTLIQELKPKYTVRVDAYVSRDLPEEFVERRVDLANVLREINALGRGNIKARLHEVDPFSEEAALAKAEYGIEAREVFTEVRGALSRRSVIFGVGVRCGLERVAIPFLGQGSRIEHELIRAIVTVADAQGNRTEDKAEKPGDQSQEGESEKKSSSGRKRVGVVTTDVQFFGSQPSPFGPDDTPDQPLIQELRRQFEVVRVDPNKEITEQFDVLLVAQPSSLSPAGMTHLVEYVKTGQPVAIFEDPMPMIDGRVPGTSAPKRPQGGMPFMMQPPEQKGDIQQLWKALGVKLVAAADVRRTPMGPVEDAMVAWQEYNPHEADKDKLDISRQWVFVTPASGARDAFSPKSPIVSGLQEVLFLYPGALEPIGGVNLQATQLIRTARDSGLIEWNKLMESDPFGRQSLVSGNALSRLQKSGDQELVLAYHVQREPTEKPVLDAEGKPTGKVDKDPGLNAIVVADVDLLYGVFFALRSMGDDPRNPIPKWNLDNVPLVLNIIDALAGETRFLNIRKRRPQHRELTAVSSLLEEAKKDRSDERRKADEEFEKVQTEEQKKFDKKIKELRERKGIDEQTAEQEVIMALTDGQQRLELEKAALERKRDERYREIERNLAGQVQRVQDRYKILAVALPPLLPLLIALCVFIVRRSQEGEGVPVERIV